MARGKGRRGRGRGGRGRGRGRGETGQTAPILERPETPNMTESPSPSNSSAVSEQEGESINIPQDLVQVVEGVVNYVCAIMSHNESQQLHNEGDESFPILSGSQAAEAAEALVKMEVQVSSPDSEQDSSNSGDGSPEIDISLQPLQQMHDYSLPLMHSDSSGSNSNDAEATIIKVEGQHGSSAEEAEITPVKRIFYVDIQHFYQEDSNDVSVSVGKNGYPEPGKAVEKQEADEGLGQNFQVQGRPIPAINPRMFNQIELTPLVPSQADLDQIGSPANISTSGTRKRVAGPPPAVPAKLACGANKRRRMKKTPPPPRQFIPRACKVVLKFTGAIRRNVMAYINQVKKVDEEENDTFPGQTDDSWIPVFIQSAISANSELTSDEVRIWIDHFPEIFTPQAIRNLRAHCNRLGEEDEADDEASGSDYVKLDPLENPRVVDIPEQEPANVKEPDEQNTKNED